jgi:quercetin dioxygenase-like cupin family protein
MTLHVVDTANLTSFSSEKVLSSSLLDIGKVRVLSVNLEAGQTIPPCNMSATVLYYVIEGQGALRVVDEQVRVQTGSLVVVPPGTERSISAENRMRVLAMQLQ